MKIEDVMSTEVVSVPQTMSLKDAAYQLVEHGITGMPVVDDDGAVVGVLSEADIIAKETKPAPRRRTLDWLFEPRDTWLDERFDARTVAEAMSAPAITIAADRALTEAANAMVAEGINRLPVVVDGKLVGIVTRADLVRAFSRSDAEVLADVRDEVITRVFWLDPNLFTIQVDNGVVSIAGKVDTEGDMRLLPELIRRLPGVVAVEAKLAAPTLVHGR
jgi:CBS-domain-containing membrane protein